MKRRDFIGGMAAALLAPGAAGQDARALPRVTLEQIRSKGAPASRSALMISTPIQVDEDLRIPSQVACVFDPEGQFRIGPKGTLRIDGSIVAERRPIILGAPRLAGSSANGNVYPEWFGVRSGTDVDNAEAFMRMREFLRSSTGEKRMDFAPGTYGYSLNTWAKGIGDLEIRGNGAQFRNIATDPSRMSLEHPFVGNCWVFFRGGYGDSTPGKQFFGHRMRSCAAGEVFVNLVDDAGEDLKPGVRLLVYGFAQQSKSFPPNARFFEMGRVQDYDRSRRRIRLASPLAHSYDQRWHDFEPGKGAPRVLPLDRQEFTWCARLRISDAVFQANEKNRGNTVQVQGYDLVEFSKVRMPRFVPSIVGTARLSGCTMDSVESDKLINEIRYSACSIGTHTAGSGVKLLQFDQGTSVTGEFEVSAERTIIRSVRISGTGARSPRVMLSLNPSYSQVEVQIHDTRFIPRADSLRALLNRGNIVSFEVESVVSRNAVVARSPSERELELLHQRLRQGQIYESAGGNRVKLSNIYMSERGTPVIEGEFQSQPRPGEIYQAYNVGNVIVERHAQEGGQKLMVFQQR
jgi:hypothetical protein